MKVKPECIACIFERANFECDLAFFDEAKKMECLAELLKYVSENFKTGTVPAKIGTFRENLIKRYNSDTDIYAELKKKSNEAGLNLLPVAKDFFKNSNDKLEALIRILSAANTMEYGVKDHTYDHLTFHRVFEEILNENLNWEAEKIKSAISKSENILYLLDNTGEVIFDIFAIEELISMGKNVIVSPKKDPIINDVTAADLKDLGFKSAPVVPSGSYIGVNPDTSPKKFLDIFWDQKYLILAKGMGNYETISDFDEKFKNRLIYILRAKCQPVATNIGAKKGELVAKLV